MTLEITRLDSLSQEALARERFELLRPRAETPGPARIYERPGLTPLPEGGDATHAMRFAPEEEPAETAARQS